ncbi:MAG: transposase [Gemmatimonadaceae bacterium]|nr:transposase [Gemmatimonadaceae bacterium]
MRTQRTTLVEARRTLLASSTDPAVAMVRQLLRLKGIGEVSAWRFTMEFFGWRRFRNRREVGALAGLGRVVPVAAVGAGDGTVVQKGPRRRGSRSIASTSPGFAADHPIHPRPGWKLAPQVLRTCTSPPRPPGHRLPSHLEVTPWLAHRVADA